MRLLRILTLTMSDAPSTTSASSDTGNQVESPNTMVATPNTATEANITGPTFCRIGQWVR
jgi:hypothetical protein